MGIHSSQRSLLHCSSTALTIKETIHENDKNALSKKKNSSVIFIPRFQGNLYLQQKLPSRGKVYPNHGVTVSISTYFILKI